MRVRRAGAVVIGLWGLIVVAGCSAPDPEPTPIVLAQGEFQDATGTATGSVTLTRQNDDSVHAVLAGVEIPESTGLQLVVSDRVIDPDETCFDTGTPIPGPDYAPEVESTHILEPGISSQSLLAAFVIVHPTGAEQGCFADVVAFANLDWGSGIPVPGTIRLPEGIVVATGTFSDAVGHVTGDVTITSAGGQDWTLEITGFSSSIDTYDLSAIADPVTSAERCFTDPWQLTWGTPMGDTIVDTISRDDPSFIEAIVVTTLPLESSDDCALEFVGFANLEWTIPDLRPGLVVTDSGSAEHARGDVDLDTDGAPVAYRVADDDILARITDRFGVSMEELEYLNPTADWTGAFIQPGEMLNLSKDDR